MKHYFDLSDKTALITGASKGIGRQFSLSLAAAGATVVLTGRSIEPLQALALEINSSGGRAIAQAMDVTDPHSVENAISLIEEKAGAIDILVNNAGITSVSSSFEQSYDDWNAVLQTNVSGAWLTSIAVARRMRDKKSPCSIINIASILGIRVVANLAAYNASKAALIQLTKSLALEFAPYAIRVNAIAPGYIATEMNQSFFQGPAGKAMIRRIPQGRIGQVEDLVAPLLLLASDASSYMTGSVIAVDGGHLISAL